jgi:hypothetical protein
MTQRELRPSGPVRQPTGGRAVTAAMAVLFLYGAFVFVRLGQRGFNPTSFVSAGDEFTDRSAPAGLIVAPHSAGYDGQFYYRIACDPFSLQPIVAGVHFDYPVYRLQRIGYPLLVWMLSFGNPAAVPWMMIIVNLGALAGIGAGAVIATNDLPVPAWSCLALALYPGFLLSVSRNLVEPLELFLIVIALVLLQRGRILVAAAVLVLAALTKETSLLFALGALLSAFLTRPRQRIHVVLLAPFVVHVAWKALLFRLWHLPMMFVTGEHFMLPFRGILLRAREAATTGAAGRLVLIEMVLVALFGLVVALAFRSSAVSQMVKLTWLFYATLVVLLGTEFWWEDWAFLRVTVEFTIFGSSSRLRRRGGASPRNRCSRLDGSLSGGTF